MVVTVRSERGTIPGMRTLIAALLLGACGAEPADLDAMPADADIRPAQWQVDTTSANIPCEGEPSVPAELHILPRLLNTAEPVVPEFGFTCMPLELDGDTWRLYCEELSFVAPVGGGVGEVQYVVQTSSGTCLVGYAATFEEQ